jgi:hypothetical protein
MEFLMCFYFASGLVGENLWLCYHWDVTKTFQWSLSKHSRNNLWSRRKPLLDYERFKSTKPRDLFCISHRIHVCYIYLYMVTFTINIPQMLAYISAPWILWVWEWPNTKQSSSDAIAILVSRMLVGIHHRQQNHVVVPWSNCPCLKRRYTIW